MINFKIKIHTVLLAAVVLSVLPLNLYSQTGQQSNTRDNRAALGDNQIYFVDDLASTILLDGQTPGGYITDDYILGTGDVISVYVDGVMPIHARGLALNAQGRIFLPMVGSVHIGGIPLVEAKNRIHGQYEKVMNNFELDVTIDRPRDVILHISGDIFNPGTYTFPAGINLDQLLKNLFPDLFANITDESDGDLPRPANQSQKRLPIQNIQIPIFSEQDVTNEDLADTHVNPISLRNVEIHRDKSTVHADLISYYNTGNREHNPFLYDQDIITIKRIREESPRIGISGAVERPQEMEFKQGDSIQHLLNVAGGFLEHADSSSITVFRQDKDLNVTRTEVDAANFSSFDVRENDRLIVPFDTEGNKRASAWVYGEAKLPGNFPISESETTVEELLEMANGLTERALPNAAYIIRTHSGPRETEAASQFQIEDLKRYSDQIRQGFEYLELEQSLGTDRKLYIDLSRSEYLRDIRLMSGDKLYIPRDLQSVVLFGQVNNPGNFPYQPDYNYRDYITQAGGLSLAADRERIFIIKSGSKAWVKPEETNLRSGDMIFVDRIPIDELDSQRSFELQLRQDRRNNIQVILATVSTIAAVITTAVVVAR